MMRVRPWVAICAVAAGVSTAALMAAHGEKLIRQLRARVWAERSGQKTSESQLVAQIFGTLADREPPYRPPKKGELEFNKQIAPIIYNKCARCHYAGGVAPFPLTSLADVRKRARRIASVVSRRLMPPWRADPCSLEFAGDFSLTNQEKGMVEQWLSEGCREGDRSREQAPPPPPQEWQNGPPDAVFQPTEAYKVAAEGPDFFHCFVFPTNYNEDRYVRITSVAPGSKAVHHVLIYTDTSGVARSRDAAEPGPGFTPAGFPGFPAASQMGQWEPGVAEQPFPDGVGYFLPKGADLVLHVHYHPTGKKETDLSRVALYFCDPPVEKRLRCLPVAVAPRVLRIRAGESKAVFWAEQRVPGDITIHQIFPHMHLLGREMAAAAILPDGSGVPIIRISNWDFRWQSLYRLKTPLRLPKGTRLRMEARFDNSAANPRNPNLPPKEVRFGLTSDSEMCILNVLYTVDSEALSRGRFAGPNYPDTLFLRGRGLLPSGREGFARLDVRRTA